jgi:hypothetical protein
MTTAVSNMNINSLVAIILGLQFAAFGWRLNREIAVGDAGRRTWFPIPDVINILSMLSVVAFCVVLPLMSDYVNNTYRVILAVAFVLMAFHPLCLMGHYRLFTRYGRWIYLVPDGGKEGSRKEQDFPYCTRPEIVLVLLDLCVASAVAWFAYHS